jgi:hypothetical protein
MHCYRVKLSRGTKAWNPRTKSKLNAAAEPRFDACRMSKSKTKAKAAASAGKTKTYVSRSPAEKAAFDKAVENGGLPSHRAVHHTLMWRVQS